MKNFINVHQKEIPHGSIFKYAIYLAGSSKKNASMPKRLLARLTANATKCSDSHSLCSRSSSVSDVANAGSPEVSDSEIDLDSVVYFSDNFEGFEEYIYFYEEEVVTTSSEGDDGSGNDESCTNNAGCRNCHTPEESEDGNSESGECAHEPNDENGKFSNTRNSIEKEQSGAARKTVRFSPCPKVHVMFTWQFAHSQARKSQYSHDYIDKLRFCQRIKNMEPILLPVLNAHHREAIFAERFREQSKKND